MKQIITTLTTILLLLFAVSTAHSLNYINLGPAWTQDFARKAETSSLEQAIKEYQASGKMVVEIINAALAANFAEQAIVTALVNAGIGWPDIVSGAERSRLSMQTVINEMKNSGAGPDVMALVGASQEPPRQTLSHPTILAGGFDRPPSVSQSTF